jgi:hypothetical protein
MRGGGELMCGGGQRRGGQRLSENGRSFIEG